MIIQSLRFSGFKNAETIREYKFSNKVMISGDNRVGKSTVGEAIVFAFYGCGLKGESKRTEDLINNKSDEAYVEMTYVDDTGGSHTIVRRKNRRNQTVNLDGVDVSQKQINQIAGEVDLFLSIFNPFYFNEVLDDKERRALIIQYSPIVDMYALFEEFAPIELIQKHSIELNKSTEYSRFNKIRKDLEAKIQGDRNQTLLLNNQNNMPFPEPMPVNEEQEVKLRDAVSAYNMMKARKEAYDQQKQRADSAVNELAAKEKEIAAFIQESASCFEYHKSVAKVEADQELVKKNTLLEKIKEAMFSLPKPVIKEITDLSDCPVCAQAISDEHKKKVNEHNQQLQADYQSKMETLQSKKVKLEKSIADQKAAIDAKNAEYEELTRKSNTLNSELASLKQIVGNLPEAPDTSMLEKYGHMEELYNKLVQKNQEARTHNALIQQLSDQCKQRADQIERIAENIANAANLLTEIELICAALSPSTGINRKAVEKKAEILKADLTHCEIILERPLKTTGDMQECFEITYDGKPYRRLSYSEQILCNLEIGKLLRTRGKHNIPLFLDNSESITNAPNEYITCDQIFMCRVEKNKALTAVNG